MVFDIIAEKTAKATNFHGGAKLPRGSFLRRGKTRRVLS